MERGRVGPAVLRYLLNRVRFGAVSHDVRCIDRQSGSFCSFYRIETVIIAIPPTNGTLRSLDFLTSGVFASTPGKLIVSIS